MNSYQKKRYYLLSYEFEYENGACGGGPVDPGRCALHAAVEVLVARELARAELLAQALLRGREQLRQLPLFALRVLRRALRDYVHYRGAPPEVRAPLVSY